MTFITLVEKPASSANASAVSGASSAGLMITLQPAAYAAPALRVIIANGKFYGVISAATPKVCFMTMVSWFGAERGMISPSMRLASSANHSRRVSIKKTSAFDSLIGFPDSTVIISAIYYVWHSIKLKHFLRKPARCFAVSVGHVPLFNAASMTVCASLLSMSDALLITKPLTGFLTSNLLLLYTFVQFPPM